LSWDNVHSATASPLKDLWIVSRSPCWEELLFNTRGPSEGCLTPNAAPSIRFPGAPTVLLPFLPPIPSPERDVARIAGSARICESGWAPLSPNEEVINELSVGCVGRLGSVGDGSRPSAKGCSGMETLLLVGMGWRKLPEAEMPFPFPFDTERPWLLGNTEIELDRPVCERDGFEACWPRELTVWMTC
jgi:hypothetical protein